MTRRRLWSITALACALMTLPTLPASPSLHVPRDLAAALTLDPADARLAIAAGATLLAAAALLLRRRSRPELVLALSRRGRSGAAIARRTGLARDAIRDVLGGEPLAISTGREGRIFRPDADTEAAQGSKFLEVLEESAFEVRG